MENTNNVAGAFLLSCLLSFALLMFYAPFYAITGFYYQPVSAVQMIGGYMVPGKPVANMMFTLYGSNSMVQGLLMLGDLKLYVFCNLSLSNNKLTQHQERNTPSSLLGQLS